MQLRKQCINKSLTSGINVIYCVCNMRNSIADYSI